MGLFEDVLLERVQYCKVRRLVHIKVSSLGISFVHFPSDFRLISYEIVLIGMSLAPEIHPCNAIQSTLGLLGSICEIEACINI